MVGVDRPMKTRPRRPAGGQLRSLPTPPPASPPPPGVDEVKTPAFRRIAGLLKSRLQIDVSGYKTTSLLRRIERRMSLEGHQSLEAYAGALEQSAEALGELHDELFIHV